MNTFDDEVLRDMVLAKYPDTSMDAALALARRARGNARLLDGYLRLRRITASIDIAGRAIQWSAEDIEALPLPDSASELVACLYADLPQLFRSMLVLKTVDQAILVADWLIESKDRLLATGRIERDDAHEDGMYAWVKFVDGMIYEFLGSIPEEWGSMVPNRNLFAFELRAMRWAIVDRFLDGRHSDDWDDLEPHQRFSMLRNIHSATCELLLDEEFDLGCRIELAMIEGEAGRFREAVKWIEGHLPDGVDIPALIAVRGHLVRWLLEINRADEAIEHGEIVVEGWNRHLGRDHPETLAARLRLARARGFAGQLEEAIEQVRTLVIEHTLVFGPEHHRTFSVRSELATWLSRDDQAEEAVAILRQLSEDFKSVHGPDNLDSLTIDNNLAYALGIAGYPELATALYERTLDSHIRLFGSDHPHTLITRDNLERHKWRSAGEEEL